MSGELRPVWTTGKTLYAVVWNSAGQYAVGTALEAFAVAHWSTYAVALTEIASSNGRYAGDFPVLPADVYTVEVYQRAGGSPSLAADGPPICVGQIQWNGQAEASIGGQMDINTHQSIGGGHTQGDIGYSLALIGAFLDVAVSSRASPADVAAATDPWGGVITTAEAGALLRDSGAVLLGNLTEPSDHSTSTFKDAIDGTTTRVTSANTGTTRVVTRH